MFTGIIEEVGRVLEVHKTGVKARFKIGAAEIMKGTKQGDSIAVNGICLTVTDYSADSFCVDVMHETLNCSSIKGIERGGRVNLERAMPADGRFGGHIVSGHIDGTGIIREVRRDAIAVWYRVEAPRLMPGIIKKGSIAIDGISLTVADVSEDGFSVSVIPHTAGHTTLTEKKPGDVVNLETDCIGKYVRHFLGLESRGLEGCGMDNSGLEGGKESGITREFLAAQGFL